MCLKYCAMFWSPQLQGDRHTGESPQEGHKDDEGTGAVLLWGKAERAATVQPKSPQGDLVSTRKYPQRWCSEDRNKLVRGSEAISTNWNKEVSIEHLEIHFYSEGDWALVKVAQELCDLPPLRYSWSWATLSRKPFLRRHLDQMTSRGLYQPHSFCESVICVDVEDSYSYFRKQNENVYI